MKKFTNEDIIKELKRVYLENGNKVPFSTKWNKMSYFSVDVLFRAFGNYKKAWESAGIKYKEEMEYKKRNEIILALQVSFIKNKLANISDIIRGSGFTRSTIIKHFGSVSDCFSAAKIELIKISDEDLLEDFMRVYEELKRIPTNKDLVGLGSYAVSTFKRRFGSISNVAKMLNLNIEEKTSITKNELLEELREINSSLGTVPSTNDVRFSVSTYSRAFGSFSAAIREIGLEPETKHKENHKCKVCGASVAEIISHMKKNHSQQLIDHENFVIGLYKSGLSNQKIVEMDDVIYNSITSVRRVIKKYLTAEEIEELRVMKIRDKLKEDYSSGKYDWIIELNRNRVVTDEAKIKNSEGLKKAYGSGKRESWNKGLTKETDDRIADCSKKISKSMKYRFSTGEFEKKIGPESSNWNPNRDMVAGRYRCGLGFSYDDRNNIKTRAEFKCELCGITEEELKKIGCVLECDHIIPIYKNGSGNWKTNGRALCPRCHKQKTIDDKKNEPAS